MNTKTNFRRSSWLHQNKHWAARTILLLLLAGLPGVVRAQFNYTITNHTVTITGYTGPGGVVTIPSIIVGLPVTAIGMYAFESSISPIDAVAIPNSVTSIGTYAFCNCFGLTNLTIPIGVTNIGDSAFAGCTSLNSIQVDPLNSVYSCVDGVLFNKNQTTLIEFPGGKAGSYMIPSNVTTIGLGAFAACSNLASVTIPNRVNSLPDAAFNCCTRLANITISSGVTSIGNAAFWQCTSLTNLTIPNSVISIKSAAFGYCSSLTNVTIGSGVTSIEYRAFDYCTGLMNVEMGSGVTNIGEQAFEVCTNLTGAFFMGNAPSLGGAYVFSGDFALTVYYLPGTSGWGPTFGGRATALWPPPTIQTPPQTQTAEAGSATRFSVKATSVGDRVLGYGWYFNGTNNLGCTAPVLQLPALQYIQAGAYTVVVTNAAGSVTSPPALLSVIAPVVRRTVPALTLIGRPGTSLNLDFTTAFGPRPLWTTFDHVPLVAASQWYFDLSSPLPPQGFYRAWLSSPGTPPALNLHFVPAITLTGAIGSSVRIDYINEFGPIDAWVNLATVTLTNTTQFYFDTSVIGQPVRLYRLVAVP